jgi:hypothetical protein
MKYVLILWLILAWPFALLAAQFCAFNRLEDDYGGQTEKDENVQD